MEFGFKVLRALFLFFLNIIHTIKGDGMKVLITGAASNIGYQVGIKLAKLGNFVYLTVHHDYELASLKEKIKNEDKFLNLFIDCFCLDLLDEKSWKEIINLDIDCLINNAGIGIGGSLLDMPVADIKRNFEVNVFKNLELTRLFINNLFLKSKQGKVIFIASLAGIYPISFLGSYCMSKASIIMMASILRKELCLINKNIQIKLIEPGIYNTGFNDYMFDSIDNSKYFKNIKTLLEEKKQLFKLVGKNNLNSIVSKIVESVLDDSNHFLYKAPFFQAIRTKLYMLLSK